MTNTAPQRPDTSPNYIVSPYRCPICNGNSGRYMTCEYPGCPDGRDQPGWRPAPKLVVEHIPEPRGRGFAFGVCVTLLIVALALALFGILGKAHAAKGFDPNTSPMAKYMESLLRPDFPNNPPDNVWSCCGKADAYPVSSYFVNPDGSYSVVIADGSAINYPDGSTRPAITTGRAIVVPSGKINALTDDLDNPTNFSWVFLKLHDFSAPDGEYTTFCFVRHPEGN